MNSAINQCDEELFFLHTHIIHNKHGKTINSIAKQSHIYYTEEEAPRSKTMNLKASYLFPENRSKMEIERSILDFEKKNQDDEDLHHKNVFSSNNDFIHQQNVCSSKNTK